MGCPHWCTRQLWAFLFTLLAIVFLIVAVASPWYAIGMTNVPTSLTARKSTVSYLFWYKGIYEAIDPDHGDSSTSTIEWSDKIFQSDKAKNTYLASAALSILALIFAVLLALFVLFGLVIRGSRSGCERVFCGFTKWIAALIALGVIVLIVISWGLFISFPKALDDSKFCPPQVFVRYALLVGDDLWCSTFAGSQDLPTLSQTDVVWTPFVGWAFAVIATFWAALAFLVILFVRRYSDYEHISTF